MRFPKSEVLVAVAKAETIEALLAFLEREKVETYQDGPWYKSHRRGGLLEWYNPPLSYGEGRHCRF